MSYIFPVFDVTQFGATGDGATDDYSFVSKALAAALAADGTLYFPKGRYRLDTELSFSSATHNITIKGDGPNVSVIVAGGGNNALNLNFNQNGIAQPYGIVVEDIGFQALGAAGTAVIVSANAGTPNLSNEHFRPTVTMRNIRIESDSSNGVLTDAGHFVVGKLHQIQTVGTTNFTLIGAASNTVGVSFLATGVGSGDGKAYRANYYAHGVDVTSCWNVCMTDCFISGSAMAGVWNNLTGYGIALHRSCVNSHFVNCHCNFWAAGFYYNTGTGDDDPNTEGLFFSNCSFVAVKKGTWITGNPNFSLRNGLAVAATTIVVGQRYEIFTVGTSDFMACGAPNNNVGTCFTASHVGLGTGTVYPRLPVPRALLLTWTGGLIELRVAGVTTGSAAFQLVNVWDAMISSMMCTAETLATTSYAFYLEDCQSIAIKGCSVFSCTYGTYSANTCASINTAGHIFTNCATQTRFTAGTTNSISTGHTLSNDTPNEVNQGGATNRIYLGAGYGAMIYLASPQGTSNGTDATISWSTAYYNNLSIWSAGNPTKLSIPAGVSRVKVSAGMRWAASSSGSRNVRIRSNPGGVYAANSIWAATEHPAGASGDCTLATGVIDVQDLTYFDLVVTQSSGGSLNTDSGRGVWFQMEILG